MLLTELPPSPSLSFFSSIYGSDDPTRLQRAAFNLSLPSLQRLSSARTSRRSTLVTREKGQSANGGIFSRVFLYLRSRSCTKTPFHLSDCRRGSRAERLTSRILGGPCGSDARYNTFGSWSKAHLISITTPEQNPSGQFRNEDRKGFSPPCFQTIIKLRRGFDRETIHGGRNNLIGSINTEKGESNCQTEDVRWHTFWFCLITGPERHPRALFSLLLSNFK